MSNQDISKEIDSALEDVRKAYRLLWLYQRRIFDICQEIGKQFKETEFYYTNFYYGGRPTRNPFKEQVWRMLPISQISFFYYKHNVNGDWKNFPRKGDYLIDLYVISDTGLTNYSGKGEPNPTKFTPINECASQLRMYIFLNDQDRNESTDWYKIWSTSLYPSHDTKTTHDRIEGVRLYGYIFNLNEMYDIDTITKCVNIFKKNVKKNLGVDL
jgi:hypothetical protein